jgi:aminopeptidase N
MHAGPYKMWEDTRGKYPMRVFARQSVADQVLPEDWFLYTGKGLAYFDQYFGIPYPFKKYDQVLVPQFLYGAMENAAAVTFTEARFLTPVARTAARREAMASVILHEMAHQWFGDLVTMRWWNGLWLNESFASYMASLGMADATEFKHTPLSFYRAKQGAYRTDESIATHPIEVPVASTANAFDNIDAITYNKGASVLHQIRQQMGAETFRRGVHGYLKSYSYRNATLDDFIGSLSKAAGRDLSPFARQWLYQPGVNTLQADFSCAAGKVTRFEVKQSPANAAFPTLREQLVQVGTFTLDGDAMKLAAKAPVSYSGASTAVPALVGTACPDLVYPNYEDWGFAKVVLDPVSAATARTRLASVEDPMLRSMLWQSLSDGLADRRLRLDDYIEAVLANTPRETDDTLLRQALGYVLVSKNYLLAFAPGSEYERRTSARMEEMLWTGLQSSRGDRDRSRSWLNTWIDVAGTPAALAKLGDVLAGRVDAGGVDIDQEFRWSIIEQLSRHGVAGSEALIAAELARDKSENGQLSALAAQIRRPDPAVKAEWLAKIQKNDGSEPFSRLRTAMGSLYPSGQERFAEASAEQRLQTLAAIDKSADPVFMRSYGSMIPATCTAASVARLEAAMKSMDTLSAGTQRTLKSRHEADQRCVAIRQAFEAGGAIGASH